MNNDRFQFRVRQVNNKLCYSDEYTIDATGFVWFMHSSAGEYEPYSNADEKIINMCTGVRDANGELIYESDVLEAVEDGCVNKFVVRWHKTFGGFTLENTRSGGVSLNTMVSAPTMKIIGNTHENPELLKEKK